MLLLRSIINLYHYLFILLVLVSAIVVEAIGHEPADTCLSKSGESPENNGTSVQICGQVKQRIYLYKQTSRPLQIDTTWPPRHIKAKFKSVHLCQIRLSSRIHDLLFKKQSSSVAKCWKMIVHNLHKQSVSFTKLAWHDDSFLTLNDVSTEPQLRDGRYRIVMSPFEDSGSAEPWTSHDFILKSAINLPGYRVKIKKQKLSSSSSTKANSSNNDLEKESYFLHSKVTKRPYKLKLISCNNNTVRDVITVKKPPTEIGDIDDDQCLIAEVRVKLKWYSRMFGVRYRLVSRQYFSRPDFAPIESYIPFNQLKFDVKMSKRRPYPRRTQSMHNLTYNRPSPQIRVVPVQNTDSAAVATKKNTVNSAAQNQQHQRMPSPYVNNKYSPPETHENMKRTSMSADLGSMVSRSHVSSLRHFNTYHS